MNVRQFLAEKRPSKQTQSLLKRSLQVFHYLRSYGYSADDIYLAFDSRNHMGMALKIGNKTYPVQCGISDISEPEFQELWVGFIGALPETDSRELYAWAFSEVSLSFDQLKLALAMRGIQPGPEVLRGNLHGNN